jgi:hypothetical protein
MTDPITPGSKVTSSYSRAYVVGDKVIMSHVEHVSERGSTTVEHVSVRGSTTVEHVSERGSTTVSETRHVSYDSNGKVEDSNEIEESKVDKKV